MTLGDRIAWTGIVLVSILCVMRAMIEHDPFPWWSSDPFVFAPPIVGLTPRWALLLNVGIILASFLTLVGQHLRGHGISDLNAVLLAIGLGVIGYHAGTDLERVLDASTIAAVICAFVAGSQIQSLPGATRIIAGVLLGFALMLTAIGVHEVFVTHPETMRMYEQSKDSFLASRGWSADSFEALSYERRLSNPEPIAWFGLTNVFASFVAASGAGLITLALASWKQHRSVAIVSLGGALISIFGLYLCGSKGGYGVFLLGGTLGVVFIARPTLIDARIILGLCVLVIVGLIVRGVVGESLSERSLLFRYQYLIGAIRVWFADPILGIGPGNFQEGYALLKPALSPEDVASPHNVVLAWVATLGLGGVALVALIARSLWRARDTQEHPESPGVTTPDQGFKVSILIVAIATIVSLRMQMPVMTRAELFPSLIGLVMWIGMGVYITRSGVSDRVIRIALLVFGGVLLTHSMIEVTGTLIVAAPIWALGVGSALYGINRDQTRFLGIPIACVAMLGLSGVLLGRWGAINRWERSLHAGAADAIVIADVHQSLNMLEFHDTPELVIDQIAQELSGVLGTPVPRTLDAIVSGMHQAEFLARSGSIEDLTRALDARPSHTQTRIAISQQLLWVSSVYLSTGDAQRVQETWDRALDLFEIEDLDTRGHRWVGTILAGRASAFRDDPDRESWIRDAIGHFEIASGMNPHDPHLALRIMTLWVELGDREAARPWAARAIELHERTRLDPIRGLSESELEGAQGLLGG